MPDPADQKVPDLLKRDFTATQINTRYVGDITYLPLATGGNLYLATVIDCCSRRVAGWAIAEHMRTELVADALKAAAAVARQPGRCCVPRRSRKSVHLKGFRKTLHRSGRHPVDGWRGVQCRQRPGGIVQRRPQTRDPPRPVLLARRGELPPRGVPLAGPLQHQTTALPVPLPDPHRLRDHQPQQHRRYAPVSGVIQPRVQRPGVRPRCRDRTSHSCEENSASAAALSKHDPTRPTDWRTPSWRHSRVNASAV